LWTCSKQQDAHKINFKLKLNKLIFNKEY